MREINNDFKTSLLKYWEDMLKGMDYMTKWNRVIMGGSKGIHKPPADNSLQSK